jgi:hypothetical protein
MMHRFKPLVLSSTIFQVAGTGICSTASQKLTSSTSKYPPALIFDATRRMQ